MWEKEKILLTSIFFKMFSPAPKGCQNTGWCGKGLKGNIGLSLKSLPNDKILDQSKFKAFADDKINVTKKLKFIFRRVENLVGKGENAGNQHFLLFPQRFQKLSSSLLFKVGIVRKRVNNWLHNYNNTY